MDSLRPELICISGTSTIELEARLAKLLNHLQNNPDTSIRSIAHTANMGSHEKFRTSLIALSVPNLVESLKTKDFKIQEAPPSPNSIGFIFSAQGCAYTGMGKNLYETFPAFRSALDHYEEIYHSWTGRYFREEIWNSGDSLTGEHFRGRIWTPQGFVLLVDQSVLLCFQMALIDLWKSFGISPSVVMGHSFGEYGAAVMAGGLSFEDALQVSIERNKLIESTIPNGPWKMIGIKGTSEDTVLPLIDKFMSTHPERAEWWLSITAVNSPEEVLVSGPKAALDSFEQFCSEISLVTRDTLSPIAFHSRAMDPIMEEFEKVLDGVTHNPQLTTECVSATLGTYLAEGDYNTNYWLTHLREKMHCGKALVQIWSKCKTLIEIGPREVLVHKAVENVGKDHGGIICPTMKRSNTDWFNFYSALGQLYGNGVEINWDGWFEEEEQLEEHTELCHIFWKSDEVK